MAEIRLNNGVVFNPDFEELRRQRQERVPLPQRTFPNRAEPVVPYDDAIMRQQRGLGVAPVAPVNDPVVSTTTGMAGVDENGNIVEYGINEPVVPTQTTTEQPVVPSSNLMSNIATLESGNNADIGYHNRETGTAWGKYGITQGAYADVQRLNPSFADRDLTTLNEQEQDAAANSYANILRDQLAARGIEGTDNNVSAAWFLGAGGLADYMRDGTISDAAARANGGRANVRRIVEQRLGGQGGAASGAALNPQRTLEENYDNGQALAEIANDSTADINVRRQASERVNEVITQKMDSDNAMMTLQTAQAGDPEAQQELARATSSDEPSLLKAFLYNMVGMNTVANEMLADLGYGKTRSSIVMPTTDADGNTTSSGYSVERDVRGRVLRAWDDKGNAVDDATIARIQASPYLATGEQGGFDFTSQIFQSTDESVFDGRAVYDQRSGAFYEVGTNRRLTAQESASMSPIGVSGDLAYQGDVQRQRAEIALQQNWLELAQKVAAAGPERANAIIGENAALFDFTPTYEQLTSGGLPTLNASGQVSLDGNVIGSTTTGRSADTGDGMNIAERQTGLAASQAGAETAARNTENYVNNVYDTADNARNLGRKIGGQIRLISNPNAENVFALLNRYGDDPTSQRFTVLRDVVIGALTGQSTEADLKERIAASSLTSAEQNIMAEYITNQTQINALTLRQNVGSGAVSDAEQMLNRIANIDITRTPALAAMNGLHMRKFEAEMLQYKADFIEEYTNANPNARRGAIDRAWAREQEKISEAYIDATAERLKLLGPDPTFDTIRNAYQQVPPPSYRAGEGFTYETYGNDTTILYQENNMGSQTETAPASTSGIQIISRTPVGG